jgi:(E)-4-hydroxy-3-methylbut-2-enyl-diphosphate synthase
MDNAKNEALRRAWAEATAGRRRRSREVSIGSVAIGSDHPVAVQSMTDRNTNDTEACIAQTGRIREAGCRIVRLTTQGLREAASMRTIAEQVKRRWPDTALVADVHFLPQVADAVARFADKVRINPGNYNDRGGNFEALLATCRLSGATLRIGVNHGSLSPAMAERYGDTPEGMVESALEHLRICRREGFDRVVVSMKSSNTRVMVHAYRMLVAAMQLEGMEYPLHLGVTEAGCGVEGRIKSAVGIGALLTDGVGDTIRVSLTEPPENEIPAAQAIIAHFNESACGGGPRRGQEALRTPFAYSRRETETVGRTGGAQTPLLYAELLPDELEALHQGRIAVIEATGPRPVEEWREAIARMDSAGDRRPVILKRTYATADPTSLAIEAAADLGVMFIDGLADGLWLESSAGIARHDLDAIALDILQASRARMSKTEFISCPGCGRTLYALQDTIAAVKERLSHLKGLKIAVMGCIVNGPGEMADADYGYVGAAPGKISLYRGKEPVQRNIPQEEALDALIRLLREDGRWTDPE